MIRLAGNTLQGKKTILTALTNIFGINKTLADKILHYSNVNPFCKIFRLRHKDILSIQNFLDKQNNELKILTEGTLKRYIGLNIKKKIDINCYSGKRYFKGLPVRGQRSRTNSRTSRKNNIFLIKK